MLSIRQLLSASPLNKLDTRVLLSFVTGFNSAQLISRDDSILSCELFEQYQQLQLRALAGEPLAYIIGSKEFYSYSFMVTPATLIPRPETELLVDEVLTHAPPHARVLDLGTGSGCIAISCKLSRLDLQVIGADKSIEALAIAQQNSLRLNANIEFIASNWFESISDVLKFDIIVSNPPYIEKNDEHLQNLSYEPSSALTDFADGLSCIRIIVASATQYLNSLGWLMIEHGYNQGQAVRDLFNAVGLINIQTKLDYAWIERFTVGQFIK